jgi:hypothetical protein
MVDEVKIVPNMDIWSRVDKTDISKTKKVTIGSYQYTAIDATYQQKTATKLFGPYGLNWGLSVSEFDFTLVEKTGMVIHRAEFFYPQLKEGEPTVSARFIIHNAIKAFEYKNGSNGEYIKSDDEFAKKLETNTISKALSRLGFNADVFLGQFEDQDYLNSLRIEQSLEHVDNDSDVMLAKRNEFFEWCQKELKTYELLTNETAIKTVYNKHIKAVGQKCEILNLPFQDKDGKEGMGMKFQAAQRAALARIKEKNENQNSQKGDR